MAVIDLKQRFHEKGISVKEWAAANRFDYNTAAAVARYGWPEIRGDGTASHAIAEAMSTFLGEESLEETFGEE